MYEIFLTLDDTLNSFKAFIFVFILFFVHKRLHLGGPGLVNAGWTTATFAK